MRELQALPLAREQSLSWNDSSATDIALEFS